MTDLVPGWAYEFHGHRCPFGQEREAFRTADEARESGGVPIPQVGVQDPQSLRSRMGPLSLRAVRQRSNVLSILDFEDDPSLGPRRLCPGTSYAFSVAWGQST